MTCEEISGKGHKVSERRRIERSKDRESENDNKRVKLPEGRRKEGYCACALTESMMKLVFVLCAVTRG